MRHRPPLLPRTAANWETSRHPNDRQCGERRVARQRSNTRTRRKSNGGQRVARTDPYRPAAGASEVSDAQGTRGGAAHQRIRRPHYAGRGEHDRMGTLQQTLNNFFTAVVGVGTGVGVTIATFFILWGAYQYMTAEGNVRRMERGKTAIVNALIGLGIVIMANIIAVAVQSALP